MLTIAHELRNQLTVIIGFSELGLNQQKPADYCFVKIEQATKRCNELIEEIVIKAKLTTNSVKVARQKSQPINLNLIAAEVVSTMAALPLPIGHDRMEMELDLTADLAKIAEGDASEVYRAVLNLCKNSQQALAKNIRVVTRMDAETVCISVIDDGQGIEQEKLEKLLSGEIKATDLHGHGMHIVRGATVAMNGHVYASSIPGEGTVFTLVFPRPTAIAAQNFPAAYSEQIDAEPAA
jgi:signal transduction histidine kinase